MQVKLRGSCHHLDLPCDRIEHLLSRCERLLTPASGDRPGTVSPVLGDGEVVSIKNTDISH